MKRFSSKKITAITIVIVSAAIMLAVFYSRNRSAEVVSNNKENSSPSVLSGQVKKGFAVISGDFIYYCNPEDDDKLYRIKSDKTSKQKISDDSSSFLILRNNRIFYINRADKSRIYGIDTDGKNRKALTSDTASSMIIADNTVYYSNRTNNDRLYSISIEGKDNKKLNDESTAFINSSGDYIIYKNGIHNIVRINKDGSDRKVINEDKTSQVVVFKDKIYYSLQSEDFKVYSMDSDGSGRAKLSEGDSYLTLTDGNDIYFLSSNGRNISFAPGHIYKLSPEERSSTDVSVGEATSFCFSDDTMFYKSAAENDRIYRISTSGSKWDAIDGRAKAFSVEEICQGYKEKLDFEISDEKLALTFEKAKEIVKAVIKPEMSDLEKTLAVHDYLLKNVEYDFDTYNALLKKFVINLDSHSAYNILINRKGVCDGYASAAKLLLNLSGVESQVVTGSSKSEPGKEDKDRVPIYHAWNVVKLDGSYYQMDVTWDDNIYDETGMLSYKYFSISDSLMEKDHIWDKNSFPKSTDKKYDFFFNMMFAFRDNNYIVYSNESKKNRLYKVNIDGSGNMELGKDRALFMVADNGWVYYSNYDKGGSLHKVTVEGKKDTLISSDWCTDIKINGGWIEYLNYESRIKYRIKLDGSSKQRL